MSPYCPKCLGVSVGDERRCPLDQQFLHRRSCVSCGQELFPKEVYCAACGFLNREPQETLLLPPEAGPRRQFSALLLDYFTIGLLVMMTLFQWNPLLALLGVPLGGVLYRMAGRSGGRQTFGQAVFHIATISGQAGPACYDGALRRSLWELSRSIALALGRPEVEAFLEKKSGTLEVTFA